MDEYFRRPIFLSSHTRETNPLAVIVEEEPPAMNSERGKNNVQGSSSTSS
jgi:hypothetical protein